MLPSDMVVEIQAAGFDAVAAARIYPLLTSENRRICALGPFPFTEATAAWTETYVSTNAGLPLVGAPTDIRAARRLSMPEIVDNDGNATYLRRDLLAKRYGGNSNALILEPVLHYNVYNGKLYIWPYIEANRKFVFDYHADPPVLGAGTTEAQMLLPDEYAGALMDRVMARLARSDGDLQDGQFYDNRASEALAELQAAYDVNMDSPDPMFLPGSDYFD